MMKKREGNVYDGKIKINHNTESNPEINLKNTTEVRNTLQKPFKLYERAISTEVIGAFQHTSK